jgi:DNA-binding NtrC family response regulator
MWGMIAGRRRQVPTGKVAIAISDSQEIQGAVSALLAPDWTVIPTCNLAHAVGILRTREAPIVLLDRDMAAIEWRDTVMRLSGAPYRCCVILLSNAANPNLWNELAGHGGYDVVAKPICRERIGRVVKAGWDYWRSQRELFRK